MIAAAVDSAAAQGGRTTDPQAIGQQLVLDAERRQPGRHGREPVALLDAQLECPAHQRLVAGTRGRDEKHRQLVDRDRHERLGDRDTAQCAAAHLDVRDGLGRRVVRITPWPHADVRPHAPQQLEQPGARGIHSDIGELERTLGGEAAGDQEKGGR